MSSAYAVKCQHAQCGNRTTHETGLCYAHRTLRTSVTPGGQQFFRSGGPVDLRPRLAREQSIPIPQNSAGIAGFPYTTREDVGQYRDWRLNGNLRSKPSDADVLDRYPIQVVEASGDQLTGWEVGVYDGEGYLHHLEPGHDGRAVPQEQHHDPDTGVTTSIYRTIEGLSLGIRSDQYYQVIALDWARMDQAAGLQGRW